MSKIILGEQQQEALDKIKSFINSTELIFSLIGYAGTGKSTMIKNIIEYLEGSGIPYVLCAPTHKAKSVIQMNTHRTATTIHSLLSLSPNLNILELDLRDLKFVTSQKQTGIPVRGLLICDESSMVNNYLFDMLKQKCRSLNCKIIFLGELNCPYPSNCWNPFK